MSIHTPHNNYVLDIFSRKEESIEFFRVTLPKEVRDLLDLDGLEDTRESYMDEEHKESRTDKLYKIPMKSGGEAYCYLLFEHKSYLDPDIYTQLLRYLSNIYADQRKNLKQYWVVIPFVFYHGEEGWNLSTEFLDRFQLLPKEEILKKYVPNFTLNLYELQSNDPDFPTKLVSLKLLLRILKHIRDDPGDFMRVLKQTSKDLKEEPDFWKRVDILRAFMIYLNRARNDAEKFITVEYFREVEEEYMTVLDRMVEKGKMEGKLEGIEEGIEKGKAS